VRFGAFWQQILDSKNDHFASINLKKTSRPSQTMLKTNSCIFLSMDNSNYLAITIQLTKLPLPSSMLYSLAYRLCDCELSEKHAWMWFVISIFGATFPMGALHPRNFCLWVHWHPLHPGSRRLWLHMHIWCVINTYFACVCTVISIFHYNLARKHYTHYIKHNSSYF
jgi:hypothetical protein